MEIRQFVDSLKKVSGRIQLSQAKDERDTAIAYMLGLIDAQEIPNPKEESSLGGLE